MGGKAKRRLMKDGLDGRAIRRLGENIHRVHQTFALEAFVAQATDGLADLELKARVAHTAGALAEHLPASYPDAVKVLVRARTRWLRGPPDTPLQGFAAWPMFHFISVHGDSHLELSMHALSQLTGLFTAEFAVRPFIRKYPDDAFRTLLRWTDHADEQVRRLASEGCRPLLPWAERLPTLRLDPAPVLDVLERLKDDRSPYVRRSVANNLADIAKDHPDVVVAVCKKWQRGASADRQWIIRRATRNLVKEGHPDVWALLGFTAHPQVRVDELAVGPSPIDLGSDLRIGFRLSSTVDVGQRLVVDYAIHHVKASGKTSAKVFKLRNIELPAGATAFIDKKHPLRLITTRRYYPGTHRVEVLINGVAAGAATFALRCKPGQST